MAESETRLETLEDEVKVLKGEVKRTLVDLRALLMREDSPLGEGAIAKRAAIQMAMQNPIPANEAPTVVEGVMVQPALEPEPLPAVAVPEPVAETVVHTPGPGPVPGAPPQPVAESSEPGPGPDPAGPGPGAFPGPGPGVFPVDSPNPMPQPGAAPGPPPTVFAPQEGLIPEGLMVGQEQEMVEQEWSELETAEAENYNELPKPAAKKRPKVPPPVMAEPEEDEDESAYEPEEDDLEEVRPIPSKNGRSKLAVERVDEDDEVLEGDEDNNSGSRGKSDRVTSIYDEYRDLLKETKQVQPVEDSPVGPPLDINLLSNLVYWAALAKQRVGEEQLNDLIQLYIQSGHSRPELKDLLMHISNMVDGDPPDVDENTSDWVDLMFHLHGILTGGFPVIKIPQIKFPLPEDPAEEDDGY